MEQRLAVAASISGGSHVVGAWGADSAATDAEGRVQRAAVLREDSDAVQLVDSHGFVTALPDPLRVRTQVLDCRHSEVSPSCASCRGISWASTSMHDNANVWKCEEDSKLLASFEGVTHIDCHATSVSDCIETCCPGWCQ